MLLETNSRIDLRDVQEMKLHSSVESVEEGQAFVSVTENGVSVVLPSTGADGEVFVGTPFTRLNYAESRIVVEELTVIGGSVTINDDPFVATDIGVVFNGDALGVGDPAAEETKFSVDGRTFTLNSALENQTVSVRYRKALTIQEAERFRGHGVQIAPRESSSITGSVSVIRKGITFIDNVDLASNWEAGGPVYASANGIFTKTETAILVPRARVVALPTGDVPFLGLEYSTA